MNKRLFLFLFILAFSLLFVACPKIQYELTINVMPSEAITGGCFVTPNSTGPYLAETEVELIVIEGTNWQFDSFSGATVNGNGTAGSPYTVTMNSDITLTATFKSTIIPTYTLTINVLSAEAVTAGCSVTPNATGPYNVGTVVELTVTEATPYDFVGFSGATVNGNGTVGSPYTVTMNNNITLTAIFGKVYIEDFESGAYNPEIPWYNGLVMDDGGNYFFESEIAPFIQPTTTYNGSSNALEFGQCLDDESNYGWSTRSFHVIQINVPPTGGQVSFKYKVSSSPNYNTPILHWTDNFRFYRNANLTTDTGYMEDPTILEYGEVAWTGHTETYTAGTYTLLFSYWNKPQISAGGSNTAWIDDIEFSAGITFVEPNPATFKLYKDGTLYPINSTINVEVSSTESAQINLEIQNAYTVGDSVIPYANLLITGDIQLSGTLAGDFTVTSPPSSTIVRRNVFTIGGLASADGTLTLIITYSPDNGESSTMYTATLNITRIVPILTSIEIVDSEVAFLDGTTPLDLKVRAIDQFGNPYIPQSTEQIQLAITTGLTYTGTLLRNFDGSSSQINFNDIIFNVGTPSKVNITATLVSNSSKTDSTTLMGLIESPSFPLITGFEPSDGFVKPFTFNYGFSNIDNSSSGVYNWRLNNGSTITGDTGPDVDHTTGYDTGLYVYTEANYFTSNPNDIELAMFYAPYFDLSSIDAPFLSLWYHAYGSAVLFLRIDVYDGTEWTEGVFKVIGDQGNSSRDPNKGWKQAVVNLIPFKSEYTAIRVVTQRGGYNCDVAIDDFDIHNIVAPVSNFVADRTTQYKGGKITFKDTSTDYPNEWQWTITGPATPTYTNGTSNTSKNPVVIFNAPGTYTVQLIATNAIGTGSTEIKTNYITINDSLYFDDFDDKDMTGYTVTNNSSNNVWVMTDPLYPLYGALSLNDTPFLYITTIANSDIEIGPINLSSGTANTFEFDHYFRSTGSPLGKIYFWTGTEWLDSGENFQIETGAWFNPVRVSLNISSFTNADFKIKLHYECAQSSSNLWCIDNLVITVQ